ncbi:DUF6166 domain-containing protein [Chelatococcus asaccharovorans]|uniref:Uncharacterized protein n=1 Tax=Chelatococcus asaccharovorans TaxID=28210 RepID=A0A2V3UAT7_9HYPH|nr:DUF6166 domain-containing protein [Chelatococcus asaccharovorans]MBS7703290.1 hypothetical protein [Chelatococcus asaccharovorans]PXW61623.1 hypothetical protein C7450_103140 [Chelatococcus asaccharovorans]
MKSYTARQFGIVSITEGATLRPLPPRLDLRDHSPTGFAWGYGGSGPAQLALALLCDVLGDEARALRLYQRFKFRAIAPLPQNEPFRMTSEDVLAHVRDIEAEEARYAV